jgi:hypothetical protein
VARVVTSSITTDPNLDDSERQLAATETWGRLLEMDDIDAALSLADQPIEEILLRLCRDMDVQPEFVLMVDPDAKAQVPARTTAPPTRTGSGSGHAPGATTPATRASSRSWAARSTGSTTTPGPATTACPGSRRPSRNRTTPTTMLVTAERRPRPSSAARPASHALPPLRVSALVRAKALAMEAGLGWQPPPARG